MALTLDELENLRSDVQARLSAAQAQLSAARARNVGQHWHERFLLAGSVGSLRSRVEDLSAQLRYLTDAAAIVEGGGTHPAQGLPASTVAAGRQSVPPKPPRWLSL